MLLRLLECNGFSYRPSMQWRRKYFEEVVVLIVPRDLGDILEALFRCGNLPAGMKPMLVTMLAVKVSQAPLSQLNFGIVMVALQATHMLDTAAHLGASDASF